MPRLLALLLLSVACGTDTSTTSTVREVQAFCVDNGTVTVLFSGCLSSSCDTVQGVSCEIEAAGGAFIIRGEATVRSEGDECTDDCGPIRTECVLPAGAENTDIALGDPAVGARGRVPCDDL